MAVTELRARDNANYPYQIQFMERLESKLRWEVSDWAEETFPTERCRCLFAVGVRETDGPCYLFKTYEDAVHFKLRWS